MKFDCESVEFGCSAGAAFSINRNFANKNTTLFAGVGAQGSLGVVSGEAKAGFTITVHDSGNKNIGVKGEVSVSKKIIYEIMEVTEFSLEKPAVSLFEVPDGYQKNESNQ